MKTTDPSKLPRNFVDPNSLDIDNSFVYLLIKLNPESSKINKNESEKFLLDVWLAIPEFPTSYQHENLRETFEFEQTYTKVEIEEKFFNLIGGRIKIY